MLPIQVCMLLLKIQAYVIQHMSCVLLGDSACIQTYMLCCFKNACFILFICLLSVFLCCFFSFILLFMCAFVFLGSVIFFLFMSVLSVFFCCVPSFLPVCASLLYANFSCFLCASVFLFCMSSFLPVYVCLSSLLPDCVLYVRFSLYVCVCVL